MTSTPPPRSPGGPGGWDAPGGAGGSGAPGGSAGVVAAARDAVAELSEVVWAAKTPAELLEVNLQIERLRSTLAAVQAGVAVEVEAREVHKSAGWASAADYLTATAGGRAATGRRILRTAAALTGAREATRTALTAGEISPEHAEVIVACLDLLPLDTALRAAGEAFLLEHATGLNATELDKLGQRLLEVLDPDGVAAREEKKLDKLERSAHLNRFLALVEDGLGGVRLKGRGTLEDAAVIKTALASLAAPQPSTDPDTGLDGVDPRDHGARTWDALVEACQRLADAQVLPTDHGMKPRLLIHTSLQTLQTGAGTATLTTGERLCGQALRRLACDAEVLPIILGGPSGVLDAGRSQRLVATTLWLALLARDRHCAFPGCRRPPIACDAHHITHWADGGPTSLANTVLLCRAHHTLIHATAWAVRLNPADGLPEFRPPPGRHRLAPAMQNQVEPSPSARPGAARARGPGGNRPDGGPDDDTRGWIRERRPRHEPPLDQAG